MNKSDIKLCIILLVISLFILAIFYLTENNGTKKAVAYYENNKILEIDLSKKEEQKFTIKGYNGNIDIVAVEGKVKVADEISPKHLCSKQGFISKSYESIVCLPNKVVIEIEDSGAIDTIAR